ncbi:PQQ-dependent sugar dehydrogenase [Clostridium isatidis]|uniref:PQQ-dependent sugar dehydrogenase n=1 Tax=Clostridium isatidis TaxID=182773 RepID=UPI003AAD1D97
MRRFVYRTLCNIIYGKKSYTRQIPYRVELVAENLNVPWAIAESDDGKIYFTERVGRIRVIENGRLNPQPLVTITPIFTEAEAGLFGIALDPNFSENHYVYVMHTYSVGNNIYSRVIRLVERNSTLSLDNIIIDRLPAGRIHLGGRLKIGPDGKLYIPVGDANNYSYAQDPSILAGKILRLNLDGSIPEDNPFPNSPVYTLEHRNPQGLAWNSENVLYSSEHGEIGHDEINIIKAGRNYGWPIAEGNTTIPGFNYERPIFDSGDLTFAPSGITFITKGPWAGKLLVGNLRGQQLLLFTFNEDGTSVESLETFFPNEFGRIREVYEAKDGSIYITTSNRDGRGNPSPDDDKILRLIPIE